MIFRAASAASAGSPTGPPPIRGGSSAPSTAVAKNRKQTAPVILALARGEASSIRIIPPGELGCFHYSSLREGVRFVAGRWTRPDRTFDPLALATRHRGPRVE